MCRLAGRGGPAGRKRSVRISNRVSHLLLCTMYEDEGDDSLHDAVRRRDVVAVERLLTEGADPDEPDWSASGNVPLLQAIILGDLHIVRLLCSAGCDVNARSARGESALHLAISSSSRRRGGDEDLVDALLEAGCDANIQENLQGRTPLHMIATAAPSIVTFRALASRCDVNLQDHARRTALHRLAAAGCPFLEPYQVLLERGADASLQNVRGETPLHELLERDTASLDQVATLLASKTDPSKVSSYRESPLHLAARKNRPVVCSALLLAGAPPNPADLRGNTPLHLAAGRGYRHIVQLLLDVPKTDVNAANHDGLTPLHIAVESGFIEVVQLLVSADRCDVSAKTKQNQTPMDLAQQEYRRRSQPEMTLILAREMERRRLLGSPG